MSRTTEKKSTSFVSDNATRCAAAQDGSRALSDGGSPTTRSSTDLSRKRAPLATDAIPPSLNPGPRACARGAEASIVVPRFMPRNQPFPDGTKIDLGRRGEYRPVNSSPVRPPHRGPARLGPGDLERGGRRDQQDSGRQLPVRLRARGPHRLVPVPQEAPSDIDQRDRP